MYIEKFGREVTIDSDHPLAVAQRAMDLKEQKAVVEVQDFIKTATEQRSPDASALRNEPKKRSVGGRR
jgi:hypothetical protein